jgi:hypothetical protein
MDDDDDNDNNNNNNNNDDDDDDDDDKNLRVFPSAITIQNFRTLKRGSGVDLTSKTRSLRLPSASRLLAHM